MKFKSLPLPLKAYILAHAPVLAALAWAVRWAPHPGTAALPLFSVLLALAAVLSRWNVRLTIFQAKMSPTSAVVCVAQLLCGPLGAAACAAAGALISTISVQDGASKKVRWVRKEPYRLFFNVANCAVSSMAASLAFAAVAHLMANREVGTIFGMVAFTAGYYLVNTFGISIAVALQQGLRVYHVWHQNFLWTAPGFFASASLATGVYALYERLGIWSLVFMPPVWLVYHSYRLYMERIHLFTEKVQQDMEHITKLNELNRSIIASLATAIDAKDRYTCSHINRVQEYAGSLARAINLEGPDYEAVLTGALVHDIGKLGVPDHILGKPGKLTPEEYRRIQSHVTIGVEILSPIPFPFPVVGVVRSHHERWDGLGYPDGLKGEEIPIGARIISLVDVFDALTSNRPYRRALSAEEALQTLRESAGKQFDPHLLEVFVQILPECQERIAAMEAAVAEESALNSEGRSVLDTISQASAEVAAAYDIAHVFSEQEHLSDVYRAATNRAIGLTPADTAVFFMQRESGELEAVSAEGKYAEQLLGMTISYGEGVTGWVAAHQQTRVNMSASPDVARRFELGENVELSAATSVPVVMGAGCTGVLTVYTVGYNIINDSHLSVLNIIAEHAAAAIQNLQRVERHRELAFTDPLTGLVNSRGLMRNLDRALRPDESTQLPGWSPLSVVLLDVDNFKQVNDQLGHLRGDDLLREIANLLLDNCRPNDVVCRYAGDEFLIILPDTGPEEGERVLERLESSFSGYPLVDGQVRISASLGMASYPGDGLDARSLIQKADARMYERKFDRKRRLADQEIRLLSSAA